MTGRPILNGLLISVFLMFHSGVLISQENPENDSFLSNPFKQGTAVFKINPNLYKVVYTQERFFNGISQERFSDSNNVSVGTFIDYHKNGVPRKITFRNNHGTEIHKHYYDTNGFQISQSIFDTVLRKTITHNYFLNGFLELISTYDNYSHTDTVTRFYPNGLKMDVVFYPTNIIDKNFSRLLFMAVNQGYDTIVNDGKGYIIETNLIGDTVLFIEVRDGIRNWIKYTDSLGRKTIIEGEGDYTVKLSDNTYSEYYCRNGIFSDTIRMIELYGADLYYKADYYINPSNEIFGLFNTYYSNGKLKSSVPYIDGEPVEEMGKYYNPYGEEIALENIKIQVLKYEDWGHTEYTTEINFGDTIVFRAELEDLYFKVINGEWSMLYIEGFDKVDMKNIFMSSKGYNEFYQTVISRLYFKQKQ
jgi:antitoxin component YwqK of YwqJK toxin-antitoxin module